MLKEWLTRLRFLMISKSHDEINEELQFHLEQQTQANIAAGMTPVESRRQAVIAFGGMERTRQQSHEQRPGYLAETLLQDASYSIRGFRRNPISTITIVATLMLGIGATTAVFSVVDRTLRERVSKLADQRKFQSLLMSFFASTGVALALIGLYGVIAFLVAQRTHEIGVRLALGADRSDILRLVMGRSLRMIIAGTVLGLMLALLATRLLADLLFGVREHDPATLLDGRDNFDAGLCPRSGCSSSDSSLESFCKEGKKAGTVVFRADPLDRLWKTDHHR